MSLIKSDKITTIPRNLRILLSLLVLSASSYLAYYSWNLFVSDRTIRSEQTVESYTRALQYDPDNATLWWQRGRLYHYSVQKTDLGKAISDYRKALELNSRLAMAWVNLSDAMEQTGRFELAENALEQAFEMQPYSPLIRWQAGNFFLRRANLPRMYECFKTACLYDTSKLGIAIETSWKIDPEKDMILQRLIPDNFLANKRYLDFLVDRNELDLAMAAWERCMRNPVPADFQLKPSSLFLFIDRLLSISQTEKALKIWDDILRKSLTGLSDTRYLEIGSPEVSEDMHNPVWNESFENKILRGGFGWRYPDRPEMSFRTDTRNRLKGLKNLEVTFEGANINTGYLYQIIPIPSAGSYLLDFYVKTDGLTTDRMPYISVTGYPDEAGAFAQSDFFPSTTNWTKLSVPFEVAQGCSTIRLSLRRDSSSKLDNRIKGILWLDGFDIQPHKPVAVLPF